MSRTAVEQIKERLSIVDVVGSYVELQHAGKNFKAKSPFTHEKTPSFYVSPDRGMYYCFSSQQGGDMFTFIEKMEGVDFKGALKILADKAGVELVPEDPKKRDEREQEFALIEEATKYFFTEREAYPHVGEYIRARGVNTETIHTWRIGYAKDEWRALRSHLTSKGYTDSEMLKAGLIKHADGGKEPYDVFRDRIMFPIFDLSGRVVAFSGRTLKKEDGVPKYVNSPETNLFVKSEILYGYDRARQGIRQYDFSLLVEGQFDLVLAHQAGYTNTVAVSGTAFTQQHLTLLNRLSHRVVLALDSDRAGVTAVKRIASMMLARGMDVKVARMEGGKDPADIIRANPAEFKHFIGSAIHVIEFLLMILKETTPDERTCKLRTREEILPIIAEMENRIDSEHFEELIARAIGTTKEGVHYEVERIRSLAGGNEERRETPRDTQTYSTRRLEGLFGYLRALVATCTGEHAWMADRVKEHVAKLSGEGMSPELDASEESADTEGDIFRLEEQIESMKKKELVDHVEYTLTEYTHLSARERLRTLRMELREAEGLDDHDRVLSILASVKHAEQLLQTPVRIDRRSNVA